VPGGYDRDKESFRSGGRDPALPYPAGRCPLDPEERRCGLPGQHQTHALAPLQHQRPDESGPQGTETEAGREHECFPALFAIREKPEMYGMSGKPIRSWRPVQRPL
jgi:hypothetical protein